jgi:UDP-N-acetylglucosamine 2-epimerase (non-hydrolysing)
LGSLDDAIRHAISKYSKGHICFSDRAKRRLLRMGENPASVYQSDSFLFDRLRSIDNWEIENLLLGLGLDVNTSYVMSCIHPVTTDQTETILTTRAVLDGIRASKAKQVIVTGPNSDEGAAYISEEIEKFCSEVGNEKKVIWKKDLGGNDYLKLLHYSQGLVGNSSSGVLEAPVMGVNSISVGSRQVGRASPDATNLSYLNSDPGLVAKHIDSLALGASKKDPPKLSKLFPARQVAEWIVSTNFPIEKGFFDGAK